MWRHENTPNTCNTFLFMRHIGCNCCSGILCDDNKFKLSGSLLVSELVECVLKENLAENLLQWIKADLNACYFNMYTLCLEFSNVYVNISVNMP